MAPPAAPQAEPAPARAGRKQAREERHELGRGLHAQGRSLRQIAQQLKMSFRTVMRYVREPGRPRPSQLDDHRTFIADWIARGGRNAAELHRLLKARGCPIKYSTTCRYAGRLLGSAGRPGPPSVRQLSFAFLCPAARDGAASRAVLDRMRAGVPGPGAALDLAAESAGMIRKR